VSGLAAVCPGCGLRANVPGSAAGRMLKCPRCQARFAVPGPGAAPAATQLEAPATVAEPVATAFEGPSAEAPTRPAEAPRLETEWKVGDVVLGLYEVTAVLGEGGMGRVYRVRHRGWDVDLAVKAPLPSALEAAGGADAFEREAETWVGLGLHPHVVACYYVRRLEGTPRLFAEFVDGGSLHDSIQRKRLRALDRILDVAVQFAWGLHYAHEQGLVHRDVKPANVMVAGDGVVKVTDFGLARARAIGAAGGAAAPARAGQTLMVAGGVAGTPAYMAPEQSAGRELTRRTDLWGWGLSVLEMFLGERTWEYGIAAGEVLREYRERGHGLGLPAMPDAVADLLGRCFSDDPAARPRSLKEAAEVLRAAYEASGAGPYPRPEPRAGRDTADSLSNRAVSLLDLGRLGEADPLWRKALARQPQHLESTYNQSLHLWSRGEMSDEEMLNRVTEARRAHASLPRGAHFAGKLLLALGEAGRAVRALEESASAAAPSAELDRDLGLALCARGASGGEASWARARDCLERSMASGQVEPAEVAGFALCLVRLGEGEKARAFYARARERRRELPPGMEEAVLEHVPGNETLRSIKGLVNPATVLAVTGDGRFVLGGDAATSRIWDARTGAAVRTMTSGEMRLRAIAVTPDGRSVLRAGEGTPPQLSETETGRALRVFQPHPGFLSALSITGDGRLAVSGGSDRTVRLWDIATGRCVRVFEGHQEAVTAVAVSADGTRAVSASLDGSVRAWDLATGQAVAVFEGHEGRVFAVALSGPKGFVLSGGEDRTIRLWDLPNGRLVRTFVGHAQPVAALALSKDGRYAFSGGQDRSLRVWDVAGGRLHAVFGREAPILAVAAGEDRVAWAASGTSIVALRVPDRPRLPAFGVCKPVTAVEVESRDAAFQGRVEAARLSLQKGDLVGALELARTARNIPGYERSDDALQLWDEIGAVLPRKGLRGAWEAASLEGHSDPILAVSVSPDGGRALSGGMDATLRLWDLPGRQLLSVLSGHTETVSAVAFAPDGRSVVSGSWDRTARLWDIASSRTVRSFGGHTEQVSCVALSPDGATLLTGSWDSTLRLWQLSTGRPLGVLEGHSANVAAAAFGPDGKFVVSAGWDAAVRAWDVSTGECACVLEGHENSVGALAISASGRQIASGGVDTSVRVWDLRAGRALRSLAGHTAEVTSVCFSPDGRYVASASRDKTVRLWDVSTGKCERTLPHTAGVMAVAFGPTGTRLLTAGADRVLRIWHLDWEPEARALPPWDEKARPYLESFVSLRLKPQTVRTAAPAWTEGDLDRLVDDLRRRGFGGLRREEVAGRLEDLSQQAGSAPSFWEDVRRNAPRAERSRSRESALRRLPRGRIAAGAAIALALLFGARSWFRSPAAPALIADAVDMERKAARGFLIDFNGLPGDCAGGDRQAYLGLAREPEVSAVTLMCLARDKDAATVELYLHDLRIADDDRERAFRHFRNAVSLMVALGPAAVDPLCGRLSDPREEVRRVAAQALASMASPQATACLATASQWPDANARLAVASALKTVFANGQLSAQRGWKLVSRLLQDPEPAVRIEALRVLRFFNTDIALPAAARAQQDPDPQVRTEAASAAADVEGLRRLRLER
jgi:WD40 repeat protein/serine/threonine protein kinase